MGKKIVILTTENFPYGGPGANYIRNLSYGLKFNSDYIIEVWLQSGNSRPYKGFENNRENSINGIDYFFVCGYALQPRNGFGKIINNFFGFIAPIFRILKERKHIKVFIVYDNFTFITAIPLLLCKWLKIRTIKVIPEWFEKSSVVTSKSKYLKWWDFIFGMKILNSRYDGLIVLSSFLKNYYLSKDYPANKILVLPNLVNLDEFSDQNIKNEKRKIIIGYSGAPVRKDGILDLLKAFGLLVKEYEETDLLIIGDISQTTTAIPFLKRKSIEYGIRENRVNFTGLVDFRNVPGLLYGCDILVLARPSGQFAEAGFPTKLGEYLACKKPVVLTKVGDIPKYFEDKLNAVLVEPDNPESIYKGLKFLIDNPANALKIGAEGYKWVRINLEYKRATMGVVKFLESL